MSFNFEEFEIIKPNSKRQKAMVISILKNGSINFNTRLLEKFPRYELEMRIHKDGKIILIQEDGNVMIKLNKNGRIQNDNIISALEKSRIKFPAYYIVERNEEEGLWVGRLHYENPNKGKSSKNKPK